MLDSGFTIMANSLFSWSPNAKSWAVFTGCLFFSAVGVAISFLLFGTTIKSWALYGVGFVIAIIMLGISYGAKFANPEARTSFTPMDLIQYLSQGFLWPSTWPGLAKFLDVDVIKPPRDNSVNEAALYFLDYLSRLV